MAYKERDIEKLYYSIGEVADMFQVNASQIQIPKQSIVTLVYDIK